MSRKSEETERNIVYVSHQERIEAWRFRGTVKIGHGHNGPPYMTLNQMDKFADKLKQLVQDARKFPD